MSAFVLDACVAASWVLPDEDSTVANAGGPSSRHGRCGRAANVAPGGSATSCWRAFGGDAFPPATCMIGSKRSGELPISDDASTHLRTALSLAEAHRLSFHDAVYLELACRRVMALANAGRGLSQPALAEKLPTIAERD
ncbi:MAG: type II toxin-antitoxin system VapC family toxin [Gammaproteobacteria bacterium]|nr:type II toxin-antitoxin system VapC family toxin [Gammaproteobacteria bacterium]